jgi:hypothetical protein
VKVTDPEPPAGIYVVMSMPAPNRGELLVALDETISKEWVMSLATLYTVIVYVVPSTRFNVGPGEVILLALVPYPYVPEPDVTEPAYKVIEVPEVCALTVTAKTDSKPMTIIIVITKDFLRENMFKMPQLS